MLVLDPHVSILEGMAHPHHTLTMHGVTVCGLPHVILWCGTTTSDRYVYRAEITGLMIIGSDVHGLGHGHDPYLSDGQYHGSDQYRTLGGIRDPHPHLVVPSGEHLPRTPEATYQACDEVRTRDA